MRAMLRSPHPDNLRMRPWRRSPNRLNRILMVRIILFLVLIALAAVGAAWVADQTGDVTLSWGGWRIATTLPVFVLALGCIIVAAVLAWSSLRALWRMPERIRRSRRERRHARGRHAITHGLLAIGQGDSTAARAHADVARRHAANDPLALLLHAQSAQLDGDREGALRAFAVAVELCGLRMQQQRQRIVGGMATRDIGMRPSRGGIALADCEQSVGDGVAAARVPALATAAPDPLGHAPE